MNETTLRRIKTGDMYEQGNFLRSYAFGPTPPLWKTDDPDDIPWQQAPREQTESFVVQDGDQIMATATNLPMTQNVRGRLMPAWGVWGVTTHPAARREGYARRAMKALLEAGHDAGQPLTLLYPFRQSFYQRLGYVGFPQPRKALFRAENAGRVLKLDVPGEVELLCTDEHFDRWMAFLRHMQPRIHGFGLSDFDWPETWIKFKDANWLVLAHIDGDVHGAMIYKMTGDIGRFDMKIRNFYYDDVRARYLLLDWIARHTDHAGSVEIGLACYEQPDLWLEDLKLDYQGGFAPMARVLNVTGIGGIPTGPGSFTARIHDPHAPWNEGIFRFETSDGVLQVSAAQTADCDLSIQGLTALVYGTHDPVTFAIRGWGNPAEAVQAAMRAMFSPQQPHLHAMF
jgi:predicted acetyltransferase